MLEEKYAYRQIYNIDKTITIHRYTVILKDGIEISRGDPHTKTIAPGDNYNNEDQDTVAMANLFWTKEVIDEYLNTLAQSSLI